MSTRSRTLIIVSSLVLLGAVLLTAGLARRGADGGAPSAATEFICPMHPQIVKDRPGTCPICGMDLVPAPREHASAEQLPSATLPAPPRAGESHPEPAGRARVRLGETAARRIGARSVPVTRGSFAREVRAFGTVTVDETRLRQLHAKTAGWVERLWANAAGESVIRGAPLLEIYSPELLAAQQELLVALRASEQLGASSVPEVAASGDALLEAARNRLRLLDVADDEIAALEGSGIPRRSVVVKSPLSGTILERAIAAGARVEPATLLLEVADLSAVWVRAAVFESELPFVREGQPARVSVSYLPGRDYRGRVLKVVPVLDAASRTAEVRIELPNPDLALKPGMFVEVFLACDLGERLAIPTAAVIETGTRSVVFVDEGAGVFAPREIETGVRLADRVEVRAGLAAGESVLAQGNFFVDSESKLRAALAAANPGR